MTNSYLYKEDLIVTMKNFYALSGVEVTAYPNVIGEKMWNFRSVSDKLVKITYATRVHYLDPGERVSIKVDVVDALSNANMPVVVTLNNGL